MFKFFRHLNTLSIDVAAGAVASSLFFAGAFGVEVSGLTLTCLGITVWLIYTADHLLDAYQLKSTAVTVRHRFHAVHFKSMLIVFLVMGVIDLWLVTQLPRQLMKAGSVLAIVVALYFLVKTRIFFFKELLGAVLYTAGILLPSIVSLGMGILQKWSLVSVFFLLALINLFIFSWFDFDNDRMQGNASLVTHVGKAAGLKVITLTMVIAVAAVVLFGWVKSFRLAQLLLFAIMLLTLQVILTFRSWFMIDDRYRLAGDIIFIYPALLMLIENE